MIVSTPRQRAAIVVVGTELVTGLRLDTNTREIAAALTASGFNVVETAGVGDDRALLASILARLTALCDLVVVTGGLGPTHDDITRDAAAQALGRPLREDPALVHRLAAVAERHTDAEAARQVYRQALVLEGAHVLHATSGTAPGQVIETPAGRLALLPGPPHEMRPMLLGLLEDSTGRPAPRILSCVGISESDAQVLAQAALEGQDGVRLTILATPGVIQVVLMAEETDEATLMDAAAAVRLALGDVCFSDSGETIAEHVVRVAVDAGTTIATAESCTGGLVGATLTVVAGSSAVFRGGIVAYDNDAKTNLLGVPSAVLEGHGAVSGQTARAMATGARERLEADVAVSVTGIAGPGGGSAEKPVGLVWFGIATASSTQTYSRNLFGDRDGVRERAVVVALDLIRRELGA